MIPVPETIAYDATTANLIESEYTIQCRVPGIPLEGIYHLLEKSEKECVLRQVTDRLAEMENIQFPATGQLVAAGCLPDVLVVKDSDVSHGAGVATASFRPGTGNPSARPYADNIGRRICRSLPCLGCKALEANVGARSPDVCTAFEDHR